MSCLLRAAHNCTCLQRAAHNCTCLLRAARNCTCLLRAAHNCTCLLRAAHNCTCLLRAAHNCTSLLSFHLIPLKFIFSIFCLLPELNFKHLAYLQLQQTFSHSLYNNDSKWIRSPQCVEALSFQRTLICLLLDFSEILRREASSSFELNERMICHMETAINRNTVFCEARLSASENTNLISLV
jgi:hypothetical protein